MNIPLMGTLLGLSLIVCPILYFTIGPALGAEQIETLKILGYIVAGSAVGVDAVTENMTRLGPKVGQHTEVDFNVALIPIGDGTHIPAEVLTAGNDQIFTHFSI